MSGRISRLLILSLLAVLAVVPAASAGILIDCDQGQTRGDNLSRGFYVSSFPGNTLDSVELYLASNQAGTRTFELVVRADSYDGALLGTAQATVDLPADWDGNVATMFSFPSLAISAGSTVTFAISKVAGANPVVFAVGANPGSCPVVETSGTLPPLDAFRADGVRLLLSGEAAVPILPATWAALKTVFNQ